MKKLFLLAAILLLAGCSRVTYPKEKLAEEVERLCRDEYKVEVSAKVVGRTLGIYLVLDSLLETVAGELSFQQKASDILEDVMMSIRRVTLSTDSDVQFFTLIGADESLGIELVMTRYVHDVKRVLYMDISRDDFFGRMTYKLRPSPTVLGKKRIYDFFNELGTKKVEQVIKNNFSGGITVRDISPAFFLNLLEMGMKETPRFRVLEIKEKPISDTQVLYFVKTKETYGLKEGFTAESFTFPPNFVNKYLILVTAKNYPATIEKIYPFLASNKERKVLEVPFPEEFEQYADVNAWKARDFYLEDYQLPDFIAFQVAQKIKTLSGETGKTKTEESFEVEKVEANFVKEGPSPRSIFELTFTMKPKGKAPAADTSKFSKPLLKMALKAVEDICRSYEFTNFNGIRLLDADKTEILNIDKSMMKSLLGK